MGRRMPMGCVITYISEGRITSVIKVVKFSELGTPNLVFLANVVLASLNFFTLRNVGSSKSNTA
jgi:hypothetical protein